MITKNYKAQPYTENELQIVKNNFPNMPFPVRLKSSIKSIDADKKGNIFVQLSNSNDLQTVFDVYKNYDYMGNVTLAHKKDINIIGTSKEFYFDENKMYLINNNTNKIDVFSY